MSESYTDRRVEWYTVAKIDSSSVTSTNGWSCGVSSEVSALLHPGDRYGLETKGGPFGRICGFNIGGRWYARKSDEDMDREHREFVDDLRRRDRERLAAHRAEWIGREEMLPPWLKDRIHVFHERGGETFKLEGWGYELAVCELAALYEKHPDASARTTYDELPQEIRDYDRERGCSGNQHDMAAALARAHRRGQSIAGTVSALSPITGSAFYEEPTDVGHPDGGRDRAVGCADHRRPHAHTGRVR